VRARSGDRGDERVPGPRVAGRCGRGTRSDQADEGETAHPSRIARAAAAVRFLSEKAGVDPRRLGVVGYGEFRPVADNSTAEGRAHNRRIAITILSEELAGADVVPAALSNSLPQAPALDTNSPSQRPTREPPLEPAKSPED